MNDTTVPNPTASNTLYIRWSLRGAGFWGIAFGPILAADVLGKVELGGMRCPDGTAKGIAEAALVHGWHPEYELVLWSQDPTIMQVERPVWEECFGILFVRARWVRKKRRRRLGSRGQVWAWTF